MHGTQVFTKLNLHHEVHTPDPTQMAEVAWEQINRARRELQEDLTYKSIPVPSTWWKLGRSRCLHCKRVFDMTAVKLDDKPKNIPIATRAMWQT